MTSTDPNVHEFADDDGFLARAVAIGPAAPSYERSHWVIWAADAMHDNLQRQTVRFQGSRDGGEWVDVLSPNGWAYLCLGMTSNGPGSMLTSLDCCLSSLEFVIDLLYSRPGVRGLKRK